MKLCFPNILNISPFNSILAGKHVQNDVHLVIRMIISGWYDL